MLLSFEKTTDAMLKIPSQPYRRYGKNFANALSSLHAMKLLLTRCSQLNQRYFMSSLFVMLYAVSYLQGAKKVDR